MLHAGNLYQLNNPFLESQMFLSLRNVFGIGEIIEVVRQSDLAVDRFTQEQIENGTLTSFCNGSEGRVSWWANQANPAINAVQTVNANRPTIVDTSGNLITNLGKPAIQFYNVAVMNFENTLFTSNTVTAVAKIDVLSGVNRLIASSWNVIYGGFENGLTGLGVPTFSNGFYGLSNESFNTYIAYVRVAGNSVLEVAENDTQPTIFNNFLADFANYSGISSEDPYAVFNGKVQEVAISYNNDRTSYIQNMKNYYNI